MSGNSYESCGVDLTCNYVSGTWTIMSHEWEKKYQQPRLPNSCLATSLASSMSYNPDCTISLLKSISKQDCISYPTFTCVAKSQGSRSFTFHNSIILTGPFHLEIVCDSISFSFEKLIWDWIVFKKIYFGSAKYIWVWYRTCRERFCSLYHARSEIATARKAQTNQSSSPLPAVMTFRL